MDYQSIGYCPHCGNDTPQELMGTCTHLHNADGSHLFFLTQCGTCYEGLMYRYIEPRNVGPEISHGRFKLAEYELVWPPAGQLHPCVPESIKRIYREASRIKLHAPNAFANQIRRCLEELCKDRGSTKSTLADSLKELAAKGEIPGTLVEMTTALRKLGNAGSHAGSEDIPPEYVGVIDDFFRAVVEYVYIAPHKVAEYKSKLDAATTN